MRYAPKEVTYQWARRVVVNPLGVSHNPCTLVARTIAAFRANGFDDAADEMSGEFINGDGTVYVANIGGEVSEQEWFKWLEDRYPVLYRDHVSHPNEGWDALWDNGPTNHVELVFVNKINPRSSVRVCVPSESVFGFVSDLERSGMYLLVSWTWVSVKADGTLVPYVSESAGDVL